MRKEQIAETRGEKGRRDTLDTETKKDHEEKRDGQYGDTQQLVDLGASINHNGRGTIYTLTIVGQVEGHQVLPETAKATKYEHVMPLLASLEQSPEIDGILLLLNTVGGDIEAWAGHCGAHRRYAQAYGEPGAGRRPLHWGASGGGSQGEYDRSFRLHDHSPGADEWNGDRRPTDLQLF